MLLQQFGGISALEYYASSIFEGAGKYYWWSKSLQRTRKENDDTNAWWFAAGVSSSTGSRGIDILQVLWLFL